MQYGYGSIVDLPPHGDIPHNSHATYPGGGRRERGTGDIHVVLTMCVEIGGVSGGQVPSEVTQLGNNQR